MAGAAAEPAVILGSETRLLVREGASYRLRLEGTESNLSLPANVRIDDLYSLSPQALISGVVTAEARSGDGDGDELFLGFVDSGGLRELPPPPGRHGRMTRENAVPIAGPSGDLTAVAWLEGPSRRANAVRVAAWDGRRFAEPTEVASAGPGSQVALAAATLDDGSALLVWARFDGVDDEIFWSRFVDGSWSEPGRLAADNAVPDVVPAVVAVPGGALAAWSRFEGGQYRVAVAKFENGGWGEPAAIGDPGTLFPTLARSERGALLLYQSSRPRGWTVVELSSDGREARRVQIETAERSRPIASADRLLWAERSLELTWLETATGAKP